MLLISLYRVYMNGTPLASTEALKDVLGEPYKVMQTAAHRLTNACSASVLDFLLVKKCLCEKKLVKKNKKKKKCFIVARSY